jgi:hypothetical protein
MLKGFEDITTDITPEEIETAKWIAKGLNLRVGKENAITNKGIREAILKHGTKVSDIRLRRMIQYVRAYNLVPCLCAGQLGYYRAKNEEEWESWKTSMKQRIRQQQYTLACAEYFNDGKETL